MDIRLTVHDKTGEIAEVIVWVLDRCKLPEKRGLCKYRLCDPNPRREHIRPSLVPSSLLWWGYLQGLCSEMLRRTDQISFLHCIWMWLKRSNISFSKRSLLKPPWCLTWGFAYSAHVVSCFSYVRLFVTLWTVAHQAPLSMGFSRQEYWSGLPCPPPGDLPHSEMEPTSLTSTALAGGFFTTSTTWETLAYSRDLILILSPPS